MYYTRRGFISLRVVVALLISLTLIPLLVCVMTFTSKLDFSYSEVNDELALIDLRRILLISYDLNNNYNSLDFIYNNNNCSLSLINRRLVLTPGYQMFLDDVDNLEFIEEGNAIYVKYLKKNKEYKTPIVKKRGIHLADFYDSDDEHDFTSYSDE